MTTLSFRLPGKFACSNRTMAVSPVAYYKVGIIRRRVQAHGAFASWLLILATRFVSSAISIASSAKLPDKALFHFLDTRRIRVLIDHKHFVVPLPKVLVAPPQFRFIRDADFENGWGILPLAINETPRRIPPSSITPRQWMYP